MKANTMQSMNKFITYNNSLKRSRKLMKKGGDVCLKIEYQVSNWWERQCH